MKQVVEFLTLLHENNDKAWFDSHKEMYKRALSCFEVFTAKLIDVDRLYMCISKSDKYMVFDEEKNIKSMSDVEAYLDKYLRMLQETMDAAPLL